MTSHPEDLERKQVLSHVTIEQSRDPILWLDSKGRTYRVNEAACRELGYSLEELLGMPVWKFGSGEEVFQKRFNDIKANRIHIFEATFHRKDGSSFPVEIAGNYIKFHEVEYCSATFHNITERKNREAELEKLRKQLQVENAYLQEEIRLEYNFRAIIGNTKQYKEVLRQVEQVAPTDTAVLILGETGTGKELLARAVHDLSPRKDRTLVKVNCAALPTNLIESELFGHEKGAFTGATSRKIGRFELADRGTIFLDEIGDLPLELQAKLLRVLQEGEIERVGGTKTIKVEARVIAATNRDLEEAIDKGSFREDLYYRLNVFPIHSPPLRERKEDIPALVEYFLARYAPKIMKKIDSVPQRVLDTLKAYDWPGNIRELENVIERSIILSSGSQLELADAFQRKKTSSGVTKNPTLDELERDYISEVLESTGWKVSGEFGAAKILGLKPTTLDARMKKLGIEKMKR